MHLMRYTEGSKPGRIDRRSEETGDMAGDGGRFGVEPFECGGECGVAFGGGPEEAAAGGGLLGGLPHTLDRVELR